MFSAYLIGQPKDSIVIGELIIVIEKFQTMRSGI